METPVAAAGATGVVNANAKRQSKYLPRSSNGIPGFSALVPRFNYHHFELMFSPSQLRTSFRALRLPSKSHQSIRVPLSLTSKRPFTASAKRCDYYPDVSFGTFKELTAGDKSKGRIVLVDFYADWCKPCHMLSPVLKSIATDPDVKSGSGLPVDVITINTEDPEGFELGQRYHVRALPTVMAFLEGKNVLQFVGALPEKGVKDFLAKL